MARLAWPRQVTGRPRVSVAIPCYNYGRYLRDCVASVLAQDGVDVQVIIVDDASTDGSAELAREIAAEDSRVTVISHTVNQGHIATFNDGLDAAEGEFVLLLSADDMLTPGALARATAVLQRSPTVGLVYGAARFFTDTPQPPATWMPGCTVWSGTQWLARIARLGRNVVATPTAVMRTSVLRAAGPYEQSLPHTSDMYMWLCAAALADVAMVNWAHQGYVRLHGDNMSATRFGQRVTDLTQRRRTFDFFRDQWSGRLPAAQRYHDTAMTALAREALKAACEHYDRGLPDVDDPAELAALAERIRPEVRSWRLWRAYERRAHDHERGRVSAVRSVVAHTRKQVGWLVRRLSG